jgi:undecaprenyl-diphosphatase
LTIFQAVFLGALQGATELFPLSSLGLTVVLPRLLGFGDVTTNPEFLPFVVALHLGTLIALLAALAPEWWEVAASLWPGPSTPARREGHRLILLLIVASIPVGILGLAFQHKVQALFAAPAAAGVFLIINGLIMAVGEKLRRGASTRKLGKIKTRDAVWMGLAQSLALLPGLSRSGVTLTAGLLRGLSHEASARFTFLMAVPAILAASLLELRHLHTGAHGLLGLAVLGGVVAAVVAYLSARYLLRYFGRHGNLYPFAIISVLLGLFSVVVVIGI